MLSFPQSSFFKVVRWPSHAQSRFRIITICLASSIAWKCLPRCTRVPIPTAGRGSIRSLLAGTYRAAPCSLRHSPSSNPTTHRLSLSSRRLFGFIRSLAACIRRPRARYQYALLLIPIPPSLDSRASGVHPLGFEPVIYTQSPQIRGSRHTRRAPTLRAFVSCCRNPFPSVPAPPQTPGFLP